MTSTTTPAFSPSSSAYTPQWPPPAPVGYLSRKALPIKRNDAEPLTRDDVQYDLLEYIFSNDKAVFTNPRGKNKVTFCTLYTQAIHHSSKCSKVLKDKMAEVPAFTIELAKISLLTNVGRINTTMAFFPEMKTALRTYHPVPSLQKTDGNAQDAPRIKNCLKAALIPAEAKTSPPSTPEEINKKRKEGVRPPTSIVNLIFVLANHAAPLADVHFDGNFNFLDLFIPGKGLASRERAQILLWLAYHYLEDSDGDNPFADDYARNNPGKAPLTRPLTEAEQALENVDTPEEIAWGRTMSAKRNAFLQQLVSSFEVEKRTGRGAAPLFISVTPGSGSGRRSQRHVYDSKDEASFLYYVPKQGPNPLEGLQASASATPGVVASTPVSEVGAEAEAEPEPQPPPELPEPERPFLRFERPTRRSTRARREELVTHYHRYRPQARTMLDHAWVIATSAADPLDNSDGELDDDAILDYRRRIQVLSRLPKPPTAEELSKSRIMRQFTMP